MFATAPKPTCADCKIEMRVVLLQPMQPGNRMDEITYRCPNCGAETIREQRRERKPAA